MVTAKALPTVLPHTDSAGTGSTLSISSGLALADKSFRYKSKTFFLKQNSQISALAKIRFRQFVIPERGAPKLSFLATSDL